MMIWKPGNDRGQVSLDYIIGITIFIFSFLFMYNLLTGLLLPFQFNAGEVVPMAERASTVLAESSSGLAISESNPNVIDLDKAKWLNSSLNNPSQYNDMLIQLGLSTTNINYNINVSLRHINNTLYKNLGKTVLNAGALPDDYANVGKITRVVYLSQDSQILLLDVRVWL
ncbi:MAG: hypothetical protein KKG76_13205 [Euryarchaeota archaeon]|nr:hypothetical protein [Euryarchaeota archaeon]